MRPAAPTAANASRWIAFATISVIISQASFLLTAYLHAFNAGVLAHDKFHISAVLDDDERSVTCAYVGLAGLVSLVLLERCRKQPRRSLRTSLAAASGCGIILTCTVRESVHKNAHRCTAVLAFAPAVALVWVISTLSRDSRSMQSAAALVLLVVLTGAAQFANVVSFDMRGVSVLPSWLLGILELGL